MNRSSGVFLNLLGGAVGGALVVLMVINNPGIAQLFRSGGSAELDEPQESIFTPTDSVEDSESKVVAAVEKSNPAVVSIVITKDVPIIERYYEEVPINNGDPFANFFGNGSFTPFSFRTPQYRQKGTEKKEVGGGSGFLVSSDGLVVTNKHVVEQDDVEYTVLMNNGEKYTAEVVARDPVNDLAIIKVTGLEGKELPFLELGKSNELKVGQTVIAIGNALAEFRNTVSVGVISGLARSITAGNGLGQSEDLEEVIQTDAAINPGNSGGPLLDTNGRVIGVNVAVVLGSENIGFSLPVDLVSGVIESVKETGRIVRPYIGVRYVPITPLIKEKNMLSVDYGALVLRGETTEELAVAPGSPADKANIEEGDILLEIDGIKLEGDNSLASAIKKKRVGDLVVIKLLHKGEEKEATITLEELPE
jgi:serine protease Do